MSAQIEDQDIHARADEARRKLAELRGAYDRAQTEARQAQAAFVSTPNEKTATRKMVAEQVAANARTAHQEHEQAIAPLLQAEDIALAQAELDALLPSLRGDEFAVDTEKLDELVANFTRDLRGFIASVREHVAMSNALRSKAELASSRTPERRSFPRVSADAVLTEMVRTLDGRARQVLYGAGQLKLYTGGNHPHETIIFEMTTTLNGGAR